MRSMLLIAVLGMTLSVANSALAQPDEYVRLSTAGAAASNAGRYDEAYALFRQAHAVFPNARSLRAMGATAFQLRRYAVAVQHYEAAITDERRALTAEQRAQAQQELEVARRLVGRTRVTVATPGATATIDGDDVALGTSLMLDPGPHELVVRASAHLEQRRSFTTRAGEEHPFDITLDPVASAGPTVVEHAQPPPAAPAPPPPPVVAPTQPAPTPRTVRVHVEGMSDGLVLHRQTVPAIGRGDAQYAPLCAAPCDVEFLPATYALGVSVGFGHPVGTGNLISFHSETSLELEYVSRAGTRTAIGIAGGVLALGGMLVGLVAYLGRSSGDPWSDTDIILYVATASSTVIGLVVMLLAGTVGDTANIRERPRRTALQGIAATAL